MTRPLLLIQLTLTLFVLGVIQGNLTKALLLLTLWFATFYPVSRKELALYFIACVFFTIMNTLSLKQGIFAFAHPDVLGMPVYELFMWGFYLLHTKRMVAGRVPERVDKVTYALAFLYAVAFSAIPDQNLLLVVTAVLLLIGLLFFHEKLDLAYTGYMILLGAAIEYTGVLSGEWYYPDHPWGGVPLWFITLWGGVGLFLRRLVLPTLNRYGEKSTPAAH